MTVTQQAERLVLTASEAAELVGCRHVGQFLREVRQGIWPKALPIRSRPQRWSRQALERRVAEMAGAVAASRRGIGDAEWEKFV